MLAFIAIFVLVMAATTDVRRLEFTSDYRVFLVNRTRSSSNIDLQRSGKLGHGRIRFQSHVMEVIEGLDQPGAHLVLRVRAKGKGEDLES